MYFSEVKLDTNTLHLIPWAQVDLRYGIPLTHFHFPAIMFICILAAAKKLAKIFAYFYSVCFV